MSADTAEVSNAEQYTPDRPLWTEPVPKRRMTAKRRKAALANLEKAREAKQKKRRRVGVTSTKRAKVARKVRAAVRRLAKARASHGGSRQRPLEAALREAVTWIEKHSTVDDFERGRLVQRLHDALPPKKKEASC